MQQENARTCLIRAWLRLASQPWPMLCGRRGERREPKRACLQEATVQRFPPSKRLLRRAHAAHVKPGRRDGGIKLNSTRTCSPPTSHDLPPPQVPNLQNNDERRSRQIPVNKDGIKKMNGDEKSRDGNRRRNGRIISRLLTSAAELRYLLRGGGGKTPNPVAPSKNWQVCQLPAPARGRPRRRGERRALCRRARGQTETGEQRAD